MMNCTCSSDPFIIKACEACCAVAFAREEARIRKIAARIAPTLMPLAGDGWTVTPARANARDRFISDAGIDLREEAERHSFWAPEYLPVW